MQTYIHACIRVHTHAHTCAYTHAQMHTHVYTCMHPRAHTYACNMHMHKHTHGHTCTCTHTYAQTHTHGDTQMYMHTHVHTQRKAVQSAGYDGFTARTQDRLKQEDCHEIEGGLCYRVSPCLKQTEMKSATTTIITTTTKHVTNDGAKSRNSNMGTREKTRLLGVTTDLSKDLRWTTKAPSR